MKKLTADDPESRSRDLVAENVERLKALFPELLTEGPNGAAVNGDVLKALVGDATVTDADEKYGLNWHGKRRARQLALTPSAGTLRPCPEDSVDWDTTQNLMIEGENLEVLKLLQKSYAGKVKLIYIDPPYNTGKDFVYPDDFKDNIGNYLELTGQVEGGRKVTSNTEASGRFHTDWLNMMYPRLRLMRTLLREDGVFFASIDDRELASLRTICDEVFGEENLIGVWQWFKSATPPALSPKIKKNIEYVVCYERTRNGQRFTGMRKTSESNDPLTKSQNSFKTLTFPPGSIRLAVPDGTLEPGTYGTEKYPNDLLDKLVWANGRNVNKVAFRNRFVWTQEKLEHELKAGTVIDLSSNIVLSYKKSQYDPEVPPSLIDESVGVGTTEEAGKRLGEMFGGMAVFSYPKPVELVKYLIGFCVQGGDLVLDCFAGSGTTGHAVMEHNLERGAQIRYVLVQLPLPLDPNEPEQATAVAFCATLNRPSNLCELTKDRLRRAAKKIKDDNPSFAGDLGFRVFKLDSSNIRAWDPDRDNLDKTLLESVEHLKPGRTEADVLYELLLKLGLDLCVPIEKRTLGGKDLHAIGGGVLMACLAEKIERGEVDVLAQGIVEWHKALAPAGDTTCVFRDSAFADDVAKTNLAAILEQHGIANVRSL